VVQEFRQALERPDINVLRARFANHLLDARDMSLGAFRELDFSSCSQEKINESLVLNSMKVLERSLQKRPSALSGQPIEERLLRPVVIAAVRGEPVDCLCRISEDRHATGRRESVQHLHYQIRTHSHDVLCLIYDEVLEPTYEVAQVSLLPEELERALDAQVIGPSRKKFGEWLVIEANAKAPSVRIDS
jgi:hypothetical protein